MSEGNVGAVSFPQIVLCAWRGFRLRCPRCGEGALFAGPVRMQESCSVCQGVYEFHPGNWSGAVMIAQMLMGLLAIPVWILLTLTTAMEFTYTVIWTVIIIVALWLLTYRNIKGLWYGWLLAVHHGDTPTPATQSL